MPTGKRQKPGADFVDALPYDGERRLMLAVLIDAIRSIACRKPPANPLGYRMWLRDRCWMTSDDRSRPFSFASICDALGIDPGYLRRTLLKPQGVPQDLHLLRYASTVEDSWEEQRRHVLHARPTRGGNRDSSARMGTLAKRSSAERHNGSDEDGGSGDSARAERYRDPDAQTGTG